MIKLYNDEKLVNLGIENAFLKKSLRYNKSGFYSLE